MTLLKAIETTYRGFKFRSRLEARWAVLFDELVVKWEYEKEAYETPHGAYLPDFWLPDVYMRNKAHKGVLLEVKPDTYEEWSHPALEHVAMALRVSALLACGLPAEDGWGSNGMIELVPDWDRPMMLYYCPRCYAVRFDYPESSYMDCPQCSADSHAGVDRVIRAREAAMRYRFW